MRQRYLLGKYNRERYIKKLKLLKEDFDQEEVYLLSTNFNRTIQSGYSELIGMFGD
jgi:hypothetical protein